MKEHPIFARFYERISTMLNEAGEEEHRIELVGRAAGRVLEVGSGNGLNFEYYQDASLVVGLEPEPHMLALARPRAAEAPVPVALARGVAEALPFPDATFDTVVASLVLCSVPDPAQAAGELARVLRPDGEVRYLEHVRSEHPVGAAVQDAIAPVWSLFAGGCHPNRDTRATLRAAGFELRGRGFPFGPPTPARPHVLGTGRLPNTGAR
jgi:ubiquinone/menaquinone biosynthesis C-methylase UbiE